MVKMKKGDRGRQAWHDTVSQLARETGAAVPGNSPQKRRETRKRVAKQTKAASRWIDDAGLDARDLTAWARVDAMLDAPKTSHLIALDADDSDGGETAVDLPSRDVLVFELTGGHRVVARPSGTEPKVKIYVDVRETIATDETLDVARSRADGRIANLMDAILSRL